MLDRNGSRNEVLTARTGTRSAEGDNSIICHQYHHPPHALVLPYLCPRSAYVSFRLTRAVTLIERGTKQVHAQPHVVARFGQQRPASGLILRGHEHPSPSRSRHRRAAKGSDHGTGFYLLPFLPSVSARTPWSATRVRVRYNAPSSCNSSLPPPPPLPPRALLFLFSVFCFTFWDTASTTHSFFPFLNRALLPFHR